MFGGILHSFMCGASCGACSYRENITKFMKTQKCIYTYCCNIINCCSSCAVALVITMVQYKSILTDYGFSQGDIGMAMT